MFIYVASHGFPGKSMSKSVLKTEAQMSATLRLVLGFGLAFLIQANATEFRPAFIDWILIGFFASNFPLLAVGGFKRLSRRAGMTVVILDTLIVSTLIFSIAGDLALVFFLILLVVTVSENLSVQLLSALALAGTFSWLRFDASGGSLAGALLPSPFFFAVALYYGHTIRCLARTSVEDRILREHRELRVLSTLLQEASESLDPVRILDVAVHKVAEVLEAGRVSVLEVRDGEPTAKVLATTDADLPDVPLQRDRYPELSLNVPAGEPLLIEDAQRNRLVKQVGKDLRKVGFRSLVLQELHRGADGARLLLHAACTDRELDPDQVNFLHSVAVAVRGTLGNALMHRKQMELADELSSLFLHSPDLMIVLSEEGRVTRANPGAERLFRSAQGELVSRTWTDLIEGITWESVTERAEHVPFDLSEQPVRRGDASFGRADLCLVRMPESAADRCWMLVGQDVSEMMESRKALRNVDRMRGVGELASGVSHELNNAWTGVLGHLQILLRDKSLSSTVQHSLQRVLESAERGAAVVKKLQNFGRPGDRERIDLHDHLNAVLDLYRYRLEKQSIRVVREYGEIPSVYASPHRIELGCLHLIQNAAQAMQTLPQGRELRLVTYSEGERVVVEIHDNGPGIPDGLRDRIFEPFFSTRGEDVSGLGLSIARATLEDHGGTLELLPGEDGACFRVVLPCPVDGSGVGPDRAHALG
jgi:PAS domain S-box-containing protein